MQLGELVRLLGPSVQLASLPMSSFNALMLAGALLSIGRTWKRTYAPSGADPWPGVNIMRPRLSLSTSSSTRRIARSSDWPCLQGENDGQVQCWEFESQLAL